MIAAIGTALWLAYEPWRWSKVREAIRIRHAGTGIIDGRTLENWLMDPEHQQPLLLDIRPGPEFAVSHLAAARNLSASDVLDQMTVSASAEQPVVIYCAVGMDSSDVASALERRGFKRVQYLDGGIFQWANERRPLVNATGPATKVKTGTSEHTSLLKREHRAP